MKPMIWTALTLTLAALPLGAQAGPRREGPRAEPTAQALQLTDAQKASIQALRRKHQPDLLRCRDVVQQAQRALRTALQDAAIPEAQLRPLFDKAAGARFDLLLARRALQRETRALLTPEQRLKAAELRGFAQGQLRERARGLRRGPAN
jgi:Spy/CpxP family protein refolding chaperone